ncbi:hypothetical protein [Sphingobacterium sp. DR205]|uniref:cytidylyltransferase domain-containing protein n=1 Tax=Sphingobacterium sp. DR205 TaxID=2713573 RepID=UPI0013E51903|nr:hypothetical protein [Sphingobacterium sp. DR205]QIH31564.1 hypothetical protein G6053_00965 [Sphingobacterium sp. DR205]
MEAGQLSNLGIIIQARMKSERLPGKVLKTLPFGSAETILGRIINTAKLITSNVIVATSNDESNIEIEIFCQKADVDCFRGEEEDVLSRFVEIQLRNGFDNIIRLTADNPFVDSIAIAEVLQFHVLNQFDYTSSVNLPLGMNLEIFKGEALLKSLIFLENEQDREHVTSVLRRRSEFKRGIYSYPEKYSGIRVTVDTVQDFLVANILAQIESKYKIKGFKLIEYVLEQHSWVFNGNKNVIQKNSKIDRLDELKESSRILSSLDYFRASDILKKEIENDLS